MKIKDLLIHESAYFNMPFLNMLKLNLKLDSCKKSPLAVHVLCMIEGYKARLTKQQSIALGLPEEIDFVNNFCKIEPDDPKGFKKIKDLQKGVWGYIHPRNLKKNLLHVNGYVLPFDTGGLLPIKKDGEWFRVLRWEKIGYYSDAEMGWNDYSFDKDGSGYWPDLIIEETPKFYKIGWPE